MIPWDDAFLGAGTVQLADCQRLCLSATTVLVSLKKERSGEGRGLEGHTSTGRPVCPACRGFDNHRRMVLKVCHIVIGGIRLGRGIVS